MFWLFYDDGEIRKQWFNLQLSTARWSTQYVRAAVRFHSCSVVWRQKQKKICKWEQVYCEFSRSKTQYLWSGGDWVEVKWAVSLPCLIGLFLYTVLHHVSSFFLLFFLQLYSCMLCFIFCLLDVLEQHVQNLDAVDSCNNLINKQFLGKLLD